MSKSYFEPGRELPVFGEYDVVVAGGGTAGMIAGIAAARNGAKTLVIERMGYLGGQFTGFMNTSWTCSDQLKRCVGGIAYEFFKRSRPRAASKTPTTTRMPTSCMTARQPSMSSPRCMSSRKIWTHST